MQSGDTVSFRSVYRLLFARNVKPQGMFCRISRAGNRFSVMPRKDKRTLPKPKRFPLSPAIRFSYIISYPSSESKSFNAFLLFFTIKPHPGSELKTFQTKSAILLLPQPNRKGSTQKKTERTIARYALSFFRLFRALQKSVRHGYVYSAEFSAVLRIGFGFERYGLTVLKRSVTFAVDSGIVNKNVFSPVNRNKSVALFSVEPLNFSGKHR